MKKESGIALISKYRSALMGFAALWILMTHEWQIISSESSWFNPTEAFIKRIGFCGVDIFFLLSGMGLTYAIKKSSLPRFYFNRLKRILVPFVAVAAIITLVDNWTLDCFLKNISGINFYTVNIYSFLWFVPAILTFYLIFPLYYHIFSKAKSKVLFTCGVIVLWLLASMVLRGTLREDLYGFTNRIPIFLIGILLGWLCQNRRIDFSKGSWLFFALTLVLGLYLSYQTNINGLEILVPVSNCCIPNILLSVSLSFLLSKLFDLLYNFFATKWLSIALTKFLGFFGMISFEFYCIQEWLAEKMLPTLTQKIPNAVTNLVLLVSVTLCGLALYFTNKGFIWCIDKIDKAILKNRERKSKINGN